MPVKLNRRGFFIREYEYHNSSEEIAAKLGFGVKEKDNLVVDELVLSFISSIYFTISLLEKDRELCADIFDLIQAKKSEERFNEELFDIYRNANRPFIDIIPAGVLKQIYDGDFTNIQTGGDIADRLRIINSEVDALSDKDDDEAEEVYEILARKYKFSEKSISLLSNGDIDYNTKKSCCHLISPEKYQSPEPITEARGMSGPELVRYLHDNFDSITQDMIRILIDEPNKLELNLEAAKENKLRNAMISSPPEDRSRSWVERVVPDSEKSHKIRFAEDFKEESTADLPSSKVSETRVLKSEERGRK